MATKKPTSSVGLTELGRSGLNIVGGIVATDFLVQMRGHRGRQNLHEMGENDPIVGAAILAVTEIVKSYNWTIEDDEDAENAEETEQQVFIEEAWEDMSDGWETTISNILTMVLFGWSFFEIVYKKRQGFNDRKPGQSSSFNDGRIGWRKWAPRSQNSLMKWEMDEEGGVSAMVQQTVNGTFTIPIEKALLFRTTGAMGNPEGRSLLRNAWIPYYFKKRIQELEAIGIERDLAGLPIGRVPQEFWAPNATADKKALLNTMLDTVVALHRNETEGLVLPSDTNDQGKYKIDVQLLTTGGARQYDTDKVISRLNQQIAMVLLADFLMLGHEAVGSKALGVSKVELFELAMQTVAKAICDVVNRHAIPRLLRLNGMSTERPPKLVFQKVDNTDLQALGSFMKSMTDAGILIPDEGLEEYVRDVADMPPIDQQLRLDLFGPDGYIYKKPQPEELQPVLNPDGTQKIDPATGQPLMGGDPAKFPSGKPDKTKENLPKPDPDAEKNIPGKKPAKGPFGGKR
jgi:phage gp29-like protein